MDDEIPPDQIPIAKLKITHTVHEMIERNQPHLDRRPSKMVDQTPMARAAQPMRAMITYLRRRHPRCRRTSACRAASRVARHGPQSVKIQ
jgi:hypothetical protein